MTSNVIFFLKNFRPVIRKKKKKKKRINKTKIFSECGFRMVRTTLSGQWWGLNQPNSSFTSDSKLNCKCLKAKSCKPKQSCNEMDWIRFLKVELKGIERERVCESRMASFLYSKCCRCPTKNLIMHQPFLNLFLFFFHKSTLVSLKSIAKRIQFEHSLLITSQKNEFQLRLN